MKPLRLFLLLALAAPAATAASGTPPASSNRPPDAAPAAFLKDWEEWHAARLKSLTSDSGWLTLVGLYWFEPGENAFGSDPSLPVALPAGKAPARAGSFVLEKGAVRVKAPAATGLMKNGAAVTDSALASDESGNPDVLTLGTLSMYVIKRGEKLGLRVKDPEAAARRAFHGIDCFAPDPAWRITARYVPYAEPKTISVPTVLGTVEPMKSPGRVTFRVEGTEYSLEPVLEADDATDFFYIFKDGTSGKETYPPGRFLYSDLPKDGTVVIDFNRAYNPPCAFTSFATCPLPPKGNVLRARVTAGEKAYSGGHAPPPVN